MEQGAQEAKDKAAKTYNAAADYFDNDALSLEQVTITAVFPMAASS